ncbi:MAG: PQQ-binding-like beta-propeller repeat protein [Acidimicrobiales bacterium]
MGRIVGALGALVLLAGACAADDPLPAATVDAGVGAPTGIECQWPTYGQNATRAFRACDTNLSVGTVADLREAWFFTTDDVVSAAPIVVDGTLFVGDWTGVFYALDATSGDLRWRRQLRVNPQQYGGQISASAAYVRPGAGGADAVVVASGDTVYSLDPIDGSIRWSSSVTTDPFGEVLGSPLVIGSLVVVGFDAHGAPFRSGVLALDLATGAEVWYFDPEQGSRTGCGGVWGSPTFDADRETIFIGTANCPPARGGWNENSEALIALDATTGERRWSFQPHPENDRDTDFAGAPNLLTSDTGRALVGLGNKDAHYYAVDRDTGELVWATEATEEGYIRPGYASGGFVGPAAVGEGLVIGATAVGDCPCLHALDESTGAIRWQQLAVEPSYAPTTMVGDLAFVASIDTVLRAVDVATGDVVWSQSLGVLASGGIAAIGDDVWAVAGFREPGSAGPSARSGVFRFTIDPDAVTTTSTTTTVAPDVADTEVRLVDPAGACIDEPCTLSFELKDPPPGTEPTGTLAITADPFSVTVTASGLGDPTGWIREGSDAATAGAVAYGVMISERDDEPNGGFLCVLDAEFSCTGSFVPRPGASYNRISILALADVDEVPDAVDGFSRLVDSISFSPPLQTRVIE